jgi:hypothetical protein
MVLPLTAGDGLGVGLPIHGGCPKVSTPTLRVGSHWPWWSSHSTRAEAVGGGGPAGQARVGQAAPRR